MSKEIMIVAKETNEGVLVQVLPDGKVLPLQDRTDWERVDALTDDQVEAAALADLDAQPLTPEELAAESTARVKPLRRALGLSQQEFAARYHLSLGSLLDWEEGRAEPDQTARAYLQAIAGDPEGVWRALSAGPGS